MELLERILDVVVGLPAWARWAAIAVATFVSEDLACIGAGLLAAGGRMGAFEAIAAAGLGIFLGDLGLYAAGRWIGRPALRRAPLAWVVHDEDVELSAQWFAQRGPLVILLGRFVPGSRLPSYFAAGVLGIGFARFAALALLAVLIWAPLLGGAAMLLGRGVLGYLELYESRALPILIGTIALLFLAVKFLVPAFTWRGRRLIVSRWRRMTRWEFWPPWLFYVPVLAYVLWLALRHRSLSLLTAVNPALPAGGFVGESKSQILAGLGAHPEHVARTHLLPATLDVPTRLERVREFMARHGLGWPLVLKPDVGQRGSGVAVLRDEAAVEGYLRAIRVDCIVQEHVGGPEFGVFYCRHPGEERGRIFSITRKVFPCVVGDGESTLERLILLDPRAVCMARFHLERNAARLFEVPPRGARVALVEIGNHCRGTMFLDGRDLLTPALEEAIDRISRAFDGFYFGRYDLRVASEADLRAGANFKILELNGATSEATHIYDPAHSLGHAYKVIFEQWRILFAIARHNAARGTAQVPWPELLRMLTRYRARARSHPAG